MDPTAEQLVARLRSNPEDVQAFSALKAHYHQHGDWPSLANLVEGWAGRHRDGRAAAQALCEAADLVAHYLGDRHRAAALCEQALERNPWSQEAVERVERFLTENGDFRRLADVLERRANALEAANADKREVAAVQERLGELWQQQLQRVDRAVVHYRKAFELDPSRVPAIYAAREIYRNAGNLKAAATLYDLEAHAEPDPGRKIGLLRELAHLRHESLGDLEGAIVALKRAQSQAPGDLNVMHDLATAYLHRAESLGDDASAQEDRSRAADLLYQMAQSVPAEHALAYCEAALDAAPGHDGAISLLEQLAEEHGRQDVLPLRWVSFLQSAPDAPGADDRRAKLGHAYVEAGQIDDAIVCFEPLLARGDAQAAEVLVDLYRQAGREGDVANALSVAASALPPEQRVPRLREMVKVLEAQGQREEAAARAREILHIDPADPEALSFLETDCRSRGAWSELRELLLAAARVHGASADARKHRLREVAVLSEKQLGDTSGAIDAWGAVTAVDPSDDEARQALARLLEQTERWDELVQVLDREALSITDPDDIADVYRRLATIHRDRRGDLERAIEALSSLRELAPEDDEARDALCDALLEVGGYLQAVPLLRERIDAAPDSGERVRLLRILAQSLEEQLQDDEGAFDAAATLLDDEPGDKEALDRMERIDLRHERWDRLIETLSYRADVSAPDEQPPLYQRMAALADQKLDDLERAAEYYGRALDLRPTDTEILDALCDVYDRAERYRDLVVLLRERANLEEDPRGRAELYRRIARILAERVRNDDGAAEAYREVLEAGEDDEALRFLRDLADKRDEPEELVELLGRLSAIVEDSEERRDLLVEKARLLSDRLDDTMEAISVLRTVVTEVDSNHLPALERLVSLCETSGDERGLADALERQLQATEDEELRVPLAARLANLYEGELADPTRAIDALYAWADADLTDTESRRRLVPLLESAQRWEELVDVLDALAGVEQDDADVSEATRRAADLAAARLDDVDGAWSRLEPRVQQGDDAAEQDLRELAVESDNGERLADLYVRMAQGASESDEQMRRWLDASRVYEDPVGDATRALEATLRAFALDLGSEDLLAEVDRLGQKSGAWERLGQVYQTLVRKAEEPDTKVRLLLRHADLLDERASDPSGALDLVLRACGLAPWDDEVLARAEELARRAERSDELLVVYDRRRGKAEQDEVRLDAILRAARLCDRQLQDRERAMTYVAQAVALGRRHEPALDAAEAAAGELDEARPDLGKDAARRALVDIYGRLADDAADAPEFGAKLLSRAAHLLAEQLGAQDEAFEAYKKAAGMLPGSAEVLDELERFAAELGRSATLDGLFAELVEEALDSRTAAELLRRRGRLLEEELSRFDDAAEVYRQLSSLAPKDTDVLPRLRSCLRRAGKYQDLLIVIDRELERATDEEHKLELLKESASTWENELRNRWEALDSWKQVLAIAPDDEDANEAVKRLGHSTRRLSADELADQEEGATGPDTAELLALSDEDAAAVLAPAMDEATDQADAGEASVDTDATEDVGATYDEGPLDEGALGADALDADALGAAAGEPDTGEIASDDEQEPLGEAAASDDEDTAERDTAGLEAPGLETAEHEPELDTHEHDVSALPDATLTEGDADPFGAPAEPAAAAPEVGGSTSELDLAEVEEVSGEAMDVGDDEVQDVGEEEVEEISGLVELPEDERADAAAADAAPADATPAHADAEEDLDELDLESTELELIEDDEPEPPPRSVPPPPPGSPQNEK